MGLDYYAILNVPRDAPTHEISLALVKLEYSSIGI